MVDEVRLLRLLRAVTDDVAFLRREAASEQARQDDPVWLRGVKYSFVTAIEACFDAGQHVCGAEGWGPPQDNGHAMTVLADHGVFDDQLARRKRQAVGFRHVLVHDYVEVDDSVVRRRLHDLGDLEDYVAAMTALVSQS